MFQRQRKNQDQVGNNDETATSSFSNLTNNNLNSSHSHNGSSQNHNGHSNNHYHSNNGNSNNLVRNNISENKNGKHYTMEEVFQVWYDNKDKILNSEIKSNGNENYKWPKPEPIYHLTLQEQNHKDEVSHIFNAQDLQQPTEPVTKNDLGSNGSQVTEEKDDPSSLADKLTGSFGKINLGSGANENLNSFTTPSNVNSDLNRTSSFQSSFGTANSSISKEAQPTLSPPVNLIAPDKLQWLYVDPSGNEQGPFNGDMMQEWFTGGYLDLELRIRRQDEKEFKTLKSLCEAVQNYIQPFKVPLPDLSSQKPLNDFGLSNTSTNQSFGFDNGNSMRLPSLNLSSSMFANEFVNSPINDAFNPNFNQTINNLNNGFPNGSNFAGIENFNQPSQSSNVNDSFNQNFNLPSMPTLLQQQIQQQQKPLLSRQGSGWGIDTSSPLNQQMSGPASASASGVNSFMNNQQVNQPAPISPWVNGVMGQSVSRINSPFISSTNVNQSFGSNVNVAESRHDSLNDNDEDDQSNAVMNSVVTDVLQDDLDNVKSITEQQKSQPHNQSQQTQQTKPNTTELSNQAPQSNLPQQTEVEEEITAPPTRSVDLKPSKPEALAPWATKSKPEEVKKPSLSLKEIQKNEAEKLSQQKKIQEKIKLEQTSKEWAATAAAEKAAAEQEKKQKAQLPPTWGNTNEKSIPVKSLAEIQKEEAELAKAKNAAALAAAASAASNGTSGLGGLTGYGNSISFASALANSVPKEEPTAWTTVASKKQSLPKKPTNISTSNIPSTKITPQLLRSVSASKPTTASINLQAIREDFLIWARSQMTNLYPSVSKNDLLEMFITLPSNSNDTQQLISETIYSSSATMDGRRFAQEFVKRKSKVDHQLGGEAAKDLSSWSSAIISSADKVQTVDEDGWSTSVKQKKKNTTPASKR
ncbi:SMY2 [Candida pseudojiufengensis]|uniref:SMY2 n=1 Tax=Candida pseudojiufengensis TaxID=497109 RepID=UPI002224946C|nr:SMY2 [Candida pseudojiufengensis]KAI5965873.1 SMY2 [Candida pseudojiufengensis]